MKEQVSQTNNVDHYVFVMGGSDTSGMLCLPDQLGPGLLLAFFFVFPGSSFNFLTSCHSIAVDSSLLKRTSSACWPVQRRAYANRKNTPAKEVSSGGQSSDVELMFWKFDLS